MAACAYTPHVIERPLYPQYFGGWRLSSAVTVLSFDDPVRVFQDFATLDLLSQGRAEIMAGRGSFLESFPLFGYDPQDYNDLFADSLPKNWTCS